MTLDGVPYIGPYSSSAPFLHVATGFGKWGMTGSMVAATLLTARLTGEDYPYADIFSPQRFFPSASISAFWEGAGYAVRGIGRRLLALRRPRRRTSPADMAVSSPGRAKNTASTATRTARCSRWTSAARTAAAS